MTEQVPANSEQEGTQAVVSRPQSAPKKGLPEVLPPYKVILHNDDVNTFEYVITTILSLTPLKQQEALERTIEAHHSGCALLLVTHQERAELYEEQFRSKRLTVTIEPDG
jgi:ATP-dependent Clp protease adaptor protein ClpS